MTEIGGMLRDSAWREVKWKWTWEVEAQARLKLGVMQRLLVHGSKDRCMDVKCKRRMLAILRGFTASLRIRNWEVEWSEERGEDL